jgi:3-phosphoshikimate 1-carboxyvinyltransferase
VAKRKIHPARRVSGTIAPPGDKSISHRYAMLAALAEGRSELRHFSPADDCRRTLDCLTRLGVPVKSSGDRVEISGVGMGGMRASRRTLEAGNSGTTMRLLAGILAGQSFTSTIDGDASLRRRPMRRVIEPLARMGAQIRAREDQFAPLEIRRGALHSIEYTLPVPSAQVKSAILLAGLFADGVTSVTEPVRTRDHTELALTEFGAQVEQEGGAVRIHGRGPESVRLAARHLDVPGDISSAVFFLAAALILPESSLLLHNVGLNPTRAAVLDVFSSMGASISLTSLHSAAGELVGDISVQYAPLKGGVIAGPSVPLLIDELPMLAALGPFTEEGVEVRGAQELRVKESDRIAALAENLRRMGATVEERADGLRVAGRSAGKLRGAEIDPHGDHRISMAFAVAALGADGPSVIRDADCAAVSYPGFFMDLERVTND